MAGIQATIRDLIETRLNNVKLTPALAPDLNQGNGYTDTNFDVEGTYFPQENLEELNTPKVKLVPIGYLSDRQRLFRDKSLEVEIPLQMAVQLRLSSPTDKDGADRLVLMSEEIQLVAENDYQITIDNKVHRYTWLRTEPFRDDNGLAYGYADLHEKGVMQSIVTIVFKYLIDRS